MRKKDNTDYYINRHSCFLLQYHIVFVTKYRHPVLTDKVKDVVYERIHYVAESPSCCTMQLFFVCGISLPVMTKNIGQRTKSKSFKKLRYYNDLIQTCTSAE